MADHLFRGRLRIVIAVVLAVSSVAGIAAAQEVGLDTRLARLGFRKAAPGAVFSCEGVDLSGNEGRVTASDLPTIAYIFLPSQSSVRANLAALERLRASLSKSISVLAVTAADRGSAATAAKGLDLRYTVVARARGLEAFGSGASQAFLVLAPNGEVLGVKAGPLDWSSAAVEEMARSLAAAYPRGASAQAGGGGAAPAPSAPPAPSAAAAPASPQAPSAPSAAATPAVPAAPAAAAPASQAAPPYLSKVEAEVVAELSLARTSPKSYANYLREYRSLIRGKLYEKPGEIPVMLNEGTKAVDEAIAFLERQAPIPPLEASRGLSLAARDHARDQGPRGATGHSGSDGSDPFSRMVRYGEWKSTAGENCAYGPGQARDIVIQLIVDDGVASRGHRANIFNPKFLVVGVAVGPHKVYGSVCVQDFAGGFAEK